MKTLVVIAGPTASGKTDLSVNLALHYRTEIVSADSRQFYRELNIGTAKPDEKQLALVRHHFINSLSKDQDYNAGKFERDGIPLLEELFQTHDVILLTGGSGLYIDAICNGIDEQPETDPSIREELNRIFKSNGIDPLRDRLKDIDPEYYSSVDANNPQRIIRALEVSMIAGQKYSSVRTEKKKERNFRIKKIALLIERDELYSRINARVDQMISNGLKDEAKLLLPYRNYNSLNTVGYQEMFEYFEDRLSLQEAVALIKQHTRNYAKRQMTWFRRDPEMKWFSPEEKESIINYIDN